jgi:hypothetical protein
MEVGSDVSRMERRKRVQYVSYETEPLNYVTFESERFIIGFQKEDLMKHYTFRCEASPTRHYTLLGIKVIVRRK